MALPIYELKEDDMNQINRQRNKDNKPDLPTLTDMLYEGLNDDLIACLGLANKNIKDAKIMYETMDIVELYELQSIIYAMEYTPYEVT